MGLADDPKLLQGLQRNVDDIYRTIWPGCQVERLVGRELDQQFGIDVLVTTPHGFSLTVQEKYREHFRIDYAQFTLEHMNDPQSGRRGEWFKLCADLYFYGYANESYDDFVKWVLFKVVDVKLAYEHGDITFSGPKENSKYSRATFYWLPLSQLPKQSIVAAGDIAGVVATG